MDRFVVDDLNLFEVRDAVLNLPNATYTVAKDALTSALAIKGVAATRATFGALALWGEVAFILGGPPVRWWWEWQSTLSRRGLYVEAGSLIGCLCLYCLRAWLRRKQFGRRLRASLGRWRRAAKRRYRLVLAEVERKSRLAALALPHVCFAGGAWGLLRLWPGARVLLARDATAEKLAILIRVAASLLAIAEAETLLKHRARAAAAADAAAEEREGTEAAAPAEWPWALTAASAGGRSPSYVPALVGSGLRAAGSALTGLRNRNRNRRPAATAPAAAAPTPGRGRPSTPAAAARSPAAAAGWRTPHVDAAGTASEAAPALGPAWSTALASPSSSSSQSSLPALPALDAALGVCAKKVASNLAHWVVFALAAALQRFTASLPLVGRLGAMVGADERLMLTYGLFLLWLQLPIGAVQLAYDTLMPALEKRAPALFSPPPASAAKPLRRASRRGHAGALRGAAEPPTAAAAAGGARGVVASFFSPAPPASAASEAASEGAAGAAGTAAAAAEEQLATGLRLLVLARVLSPAGARTVSEVCADGWVLSAALFFATPPLLTAHAVIGAGLVYPAARTAALLVRTPPAATRSPLRPTGGGGGGGGEGSGWGGEEGEARGSAALLESQVRWLKYWAVYALLLHAGHELARTGLSRLLLFGMGTYASLALALWLQLPYFRGAVRLHAQGTNALAAAAAALLRTGGGGGGESGGGGERPETPATTAPALLSTAGARDQPERIPPAAAAAGHTRSKAVDAAGAGRSARESAGGEEGEKGSLGTPGRTEEKVEEGKSAPAPQEQGRVPAAVPCSDDTEVAASSGGVEEAAPPEGRVPSAADAIAAEELRGEVESWELPSKKNN